MEGGWDRPRDRARMLGGPNGNNKGNEDDDDKYGKDGDISDEPFDFFHAATNQKHAGVMEGGWDRPHDRARTLGERDGNDEGNEDDYDEYGKDGNIPDDEDKYASGRQTTKKIHNNQPKTCGLDGGETRYEAQPAGGAVGARVDRFRAIKLG